MVLLVGDVAVNLACAPGVNVNESDAVPSVVVAEKTACVTKSRSNAVDTG